MIENYFMVRKMKNTKKISKIYTKFLTYDDMTLIITALTILIK
ncbi:alpha-amanitin sensitive protein [Goatpox virus]|uniref:Alpha-amanitin sensitive protein n=2 Tax=Goatpox virus TaxID=186805 RepID=A0A075CL48_9POXV|nr:alpha-amanitin sensitive protein [Goatpox virus FZ]AXA19968.1 alpha-amanitin sensitive protein [Goatpox virus]